MSGFRVTKHDPERRDEAGRHLGNDWTSISDIGREFDEGVLTESSYMAVEDAYVESVRRFMGAADVTALRVTSLERTEADNASTQMIGPELARRLRAATENEELGLADIELMVRLNLRESLWCRLEGAHGFYVHFGYDYYMYIGSSTDLAAPTVPAGMYVERFESPYLTG